MERESRFNDFRQVWQQWSTKLEVVGAALAAWFVQSPETAIAAWAMLPADMKAMLPPQLVGYMAVALFIAALVAKHVNQPKLRRK